MINEMIPAHDVAEDYIDHEMLDEELTTLLASCRYYWVMFNSRDFYEEVLEKILTGIGSALETCWLDGGYGNLIPGRGIVKSSHIVR